MASPQSASIRATFASFKEAPLTSVQQNREAWEAAAQTELPPHTIIEPLFVEGIACEKVSSSQVDQEKLLLYLHGGGFNAGSCKTHRELAARLSLATSLPVLLVDYRLAPEHPFPAAIEDAVTVYRWLLAHGYRPEQVVIGGDSSGGGAALTTLLALRATGDVLPAAAVLLSPWLDLALAGESMVSRADVDPLVTREALARAAQLYANGQDLHDPIISPVYADMHGLPPMLIQVGDDEILLSDSLRAADQARAAGVDVELAVWPEMWHVWQSFAATLPEAQQALEQIGAYLRQRLAVPS